MKSILKSTCAFVLSLCIVVTFMPTAVFAVTEPVDEDTAVVTEEMDADQAEPEAVVEAEDEEAAPEEVVLEPVSDEEMEARRAAWKPRQPRVTDGYLLRYASMVTSGNRGAILEVPGKGGNE